MSACRSKPDASFDASPGSVTERGARFRRSIRGYALRIMPTAAPIDRMPTIDALIECGGTCDVLTFRL